MGAMFADCEDRVLSTLECNELQFRRKASSPQDSDDFQLSIVVLLRIRLLKSIISTKFGVRFQPYRRRDDLPGRAKPLPL